MQKSSRRVRPSFAQPDGRDVRLNIQSARPKMYLRIPYKRAQAVKIATNNKGETNMNAVELLKQDHEIVEGLFKQVEDTPPSRHAALFKRIKGELEAHAHIEEVVFYPALKKRGTKEAKDIVLEGFEEHHHMHIALREISRLTPKSERFEPKLKVMIEMTRHHVKEEEGMGGMFDRSTVELGYAMLDTLGEKMAREKLKFIKAKRIKPEPRPEHSPGMIATAIETAKSAVAAITGSGDEPKKKATKAKARKTSAASKPKGATKSKAAVAGRK